MFKEEKPNWQYYAQDGIDLIEGLNTKLLKNNSVNESNALDKCITDMFGEFYEIENIDLEIHDDYTNISDADQDTVVTFNNPDTRSARGVVVNKHSLGNVFGQRREKMIELKILDEREEIE